jgi:NAD-dependent SIR2 family protein deacetylase
MNLDKPGKLLSIGKRQLGVYAEFEYFRCQDCGADYPIIDGAIRCNGFTISDCPGCGTRSKRALEVRN